jgi:putative ABC transport system substrate-binding protein
LYRIGYLGNTFSTPETLAVREAFRQGLRERGWVEGSNILIEYRWAEGKFDRLADFAAELVGLKVDLILAQSSIYVEAARKATLTIPIVFALHADPVGSGHVASIRRPGGNITGLALMQSEFSAKGLEILKQAVPHATRMAVLWHPATPSHGPGMRAVEAAASVLGVRVQSVPVRGPDDFEGAFSAMARERADALLVIAASPFYVAHRQLADLALRHGLPTMFGARAHAEAGGLLSYAADYPDLMRRSAAYVDKILKGANPADLPVEQATRFEFVVNLKAAKALGITIPQSILVRADAVIQ